MDSHEAEKTTTEPDRAPADEAATEFFPDFTTVRIALKAGQIGVWSWDLATNAVTWSSNIESIYALPAGSFDGTFAFFEHTIHEEDRPKVVEAINETLRSGRPYWARYRVAARSAREEFWVEATGTVTFENGAPVRMVGLCQDVTEQVKLQEELRIRATQQEALARLGERTLAEPDIETLLDDVVSTVALTLSVDLVNILELMPGDGELLLRAGRGWSAGGIGLIVMSKERDGYARRILAAATAVVTPDFAAETRFAIPRYLADHRCVSGMSTTIAGQDGRAYGILGVFTTKRRHFSVRDSSFLAAVADLVAGVIQRQQLQQRHELMIRELRHRFGNLFSQLLALFSQTANNSKTMAELTSKYQARVLALANAHRLITEAGWRTTSLAELLRVVLGPYLDRTSFTGPNVDLAPDPTFSLSAALHELAANAIKHGSLSRRQGRLELSWSVAGTERGSILTLDWIERNGPPARRPRRVGFGSRLIGLVIERQMNGEVRRSYGRAGLSVRMIVPLAHERWPIPAPPAAMTQSASR
ncbi:MAG TPA: HWE histidine kinase domain-containing protein [Xanthobacteraceae bacterium]|nr:HWE histidine kinase domain-containing protein [Xanthobacteraceae bacterium]